MTGLTDLPNRFEDERLLWTENWSLEPPPADPEGEPQRLAWRRGRLRAVEDLPDITAYEPWRSGHRD